MEGGIYQVIVLIVAAYALMKGFRRGIAGQICGVMGMAFAIVCSYLFSGEVAENLRMVFPKTGNYPFPSFLYSIVASALIYTFVYYCFKIFTRILRNAMRIFRLGMLDKLAGAAFSLFKYMLGLSLIYNLILCVKPDSPLMQYSRADDGNMVASVLMLAPDILGSLSVEDLSHAMQLLDAKKISCNFKSSNSVIDNKEEVV